MNDGIYMFFPVPVGIYDIDDPQMDSEIIDTIDNGNGTGSRFANIWDYNTPALNKLKSIFIDKAKSTLKYYPGKYKEIVASRGWTETLRKNQFHHAHAHSWSLISACYYVECPNKGDVGDFLLFDPAAGTMWSNYSDGNHNSRVFQRITPKKGRMIVFPGHITHATDPNKTDQRRTTIATDFLVRPL